MNIHIFVVHPQKMIFYWDTPCNPLWPPPTCIMPNSRPNHCGCWSCRIADVAWIPIRVLKKLAISSLCRYLRGNPQTLFWLMSPAWPSVLQDSSGVRLSSQTWNSPNCTVNRHISRFPKNWGTPSHHGFKVVEYDLDGLGYPYILGHPDINHLGTI